MRQPGRSYLIFVYPYYLATSTVIATVYHIHDSTSMGNPILSICVDDVVAMNSQNEKQERGTRALEVQTGNTRESDDLDEEGDDRRRESNRNKEVRGTHEWWKSNHRGP